MKLYLGGFQDYQGVVAAKDQHEAEEKLRQELSLHALPVEAQEVSIEGYVIELKKEQPCKNSDVPTAENCLPKSKAK